MTLLAVVGFLAGLALGQRFTVMIVIPGTVVLLVLAVETGVTHANTPWLIALTTVVAAASMQLGYLVGIGVQNVRVARFARRSPPLVSPRSHAAR